MVFAHLGIKDSKAVLVPDDSWTPTKAGDDEGKMPRNPNNPESCAVLRVVIESLH